MSSNDNSTRIPGLINSNTNLLQINEAVRSGRDHLEEMVRSRDLEIQTLLRDVQSLRDAKQTIDLKDLEIARYQDSIITWRQKDEALNILVNKYGNALGHSASEIRTELGENILRLAQEKPEYSNTSLTNSVRKSLEENSNKSE